MSKRNNKSGRFEHQYKKSSFIANQIAQYLKGLNWLDRIWFLSSPVEFVAHHIDIKLRQIFKRLEDTDKL